MTRLLRQTLLAWVTLFCLWSQSEPIHRLGHGKFWNLGDAEDMPDDSFEGRFAGLLPPRSKEV